MKRLKISEDALDRRIDAVIDFVLFYGIFGGLFGVMTIATLRGSAL